MRRVHPVGDRRLVRETGDIARSRTEAFRKRIPALAAWALCVGAGTLTAAEPTFESHWQDGKAELDAYRYEVVRYGERRIGEAVMIFVTEPWSEAKRVKVEDASRNPADTFEALKLNFVRDFTTGIYNYDTMVSVFARSRDVSPVEVSLSSAEWCGHVYTKLRFEGRTVREDLWSYFEGETGSRTLDVPSGGVTEDLLYLTLRGLRGPYLKPGETRTVPFLPGLLHSRLTHRPLEWTTAEIGRSRTPAEPTEVPAGRFEAGVYTVRVANGREGRFWIEADYPHRILKWTWSGSAGRGQEAAESGELLGTLREAYWKLNGPGNETYRERLGLTPSAP